MLVALKRFRCRVFGKGYRVADLRLGNGFNRSGNIPDLTCGELIRGLELGGEYSNLRDLKFISAVHEANPVACLNYAVHYADIAQSTLVIIVIAVEYQRPERSFGIAHGSREVGNDTGEHLLNVEACLCRYLRCIVRRNADDIVNLTDCVLGVCRRQIDLVNDGKDFEIVINGQVDVCKGLSFDALRGVNDENRAFAGCERTADLVCEVNMPRSVDKVQHISFAVGMGIEHPDRCGFDGDSAFALDVH